MARVFALRTALEAASLVAVPVDSLALGLRPSGRRRAGLVRDSFGDLVGAR